MSASPLHDKTRSIHNLSRKRLILDYVDPYGGSLVAESSVSSLRGRMNHTNCFSSGLSQENEEPNMFHRRKEKSLLESWQIISPRKLDPGTLFPSVAVPVTVSTPKYKCQTRREESPPGFKQPPHASLPPSSPPSLGNHLDIVPKEDDDTEDEQDPFGFLAMEQILKARKRPLLAKRSGFLRRGIEHGSFNDGIGGCANAAVTSPPGNEIIRQQQSFFDGRDGRSTRSPEQGEIQPLSPCQLFARRKSKHKNGIQKGKKEKLDKQEVHQPKPKVIQQENISSKRPRKRTGRQGRGKRGTTFQGSEALGREELEMQKREERIRYYQQLESYRLAKENVWVI